MMIVIIITNITPAPSLPFPNLKFRSKRCLPSVSSERKIVWHKTAFQNQKRLLVNLKHIHLLKFWLTWIFRHFSSGMWFRPQKNAKLRISKEKANPPQQTFPTKSLFEHKLRCTNVKGGKVSNLRNSKLDGSWKIIKWLK